MSGRKPDHISKILVCFFELDVVDMINAALDFGIDGRVFYPLALGSAYSQENQKQHHGIWCCHQ